MNIRRATQDDVDLLAQLNRHVHQYHVDAVPHIFKMADDADVAQKYADILAEEGHYIYIGEVDGQAVGYVYAIVQHRPENVFTYARDYVHIDQMSVNPDQQGKGYGRQLMQMVFDLARSLDIRQVTLGVWDFNESAIGFYQKLGFSHVVHSMMNIKI